MKKDRIICPVCSYRDSRQMISVENQAIYRCNKCKMVYAHCTDSPKVRDLIKREHEKNKINRQARLSVDRMRINSISKYLKDGISGSRILEVGCGAGTFLELCHGFKADYYGIEPDPDLFNYCLQQFPLLKGRIMNCAFENAGLKAGSFDIIAVNHVLEHVVDPVKFLRLCRTYLRPGGAIYIEVPNESFILLKSVLKKLLGVYSGFPTHVEHKSLFERHTLRNTVARAEFKRVVLGQRSLWGDLNVIKVSMGDRPIPAILKIAATFFRMTKVDMLLRQGQLLCIAFK